MLEIHHLTSLRHSREDSTLASHERRMAHLLAERGKGRSAMTATMARATHVVLIGPLSAATVRTGTVTGPDATTAAAERDDAIHRVRRRVVGLRRQVNEGSKGSE
jgi:hypothetical protein